MSAGANPIPPHDKHSGKPRSQLTQLREMQLLQTYRESGADAQEALRELLEAYQHRIFGVCFRMVGNPDQAGDLTQDSLIKVIEGLDSYDGRSQLSTWIIQVTMNHCLSWLRMEKRRTHARLEESDPRHGAGGPESPVSTGPKAPILKSREPLPPSGVEHEQKKAKVLKVLAMMDDEPRAILVLRDIQDFSYQQLSEIFQVGVGTIKSRLFQARNAFRKYMQEIEDKEH